MKNIRYTLAQLTPFSLFNKSEKAMTMLDSSSSTDYSSLHILLVDDDEFLLDLMKSTFQDLRVGSVQLASNGIEGLKVYRNSLPKPNLIICDLCMPQLGGMELLSHLALDGCQANIMIISGHNLVPPTSGNWNLANYNGPVLNLAEKIARIQGLKVRASFEKPISRNKIVEMLDLGLTKANQSNTRPI